MKPCVKNMILIEVEEPKATDSINRRNLNNKKIKINNLIKKIGSIEDYINYYSSHTRANTCNKFNINRDEHELILSIANYVKDKANIIKAARKKYYYNNIYFDSLPEVAVYVYYLDHHVNIVFEPRSFSFIYNDKIYKYIPDFEIDGKLVEIKGDHFFKKDGTMCNPFDHSQDELYEAKHQCMITNNIEI